MTIEHNCIKKIDTFRKLVTGETLYDSKFILTSPMIDIDIEKYVITERKQNNDSAEQKLAKNKHTFIMSTNRQW